MSPGLMCVKLNVRRLVFVQSRQFSVHLKVAAACACFVFKSGENSFGNWSAAVCRCNSHLSISCSWKWLGS